MGEEKEKKKKKKKDKKKDEEAPEPVAEPEPEKKSSKASKKKSSKKKEGGGAKLSGPLSIFSEAQLKDFKNGFNYMDQDKDGVITKSDLFRTYDIIGKLASDAELEGMLGESESPITFTQMLTLFADKMEGAADDDEVIIESFNKFDEGDGSIDPDQFMSMLQGKGEPLSKKECDEIYPELPQTEEAPHPRYFSLKGVIQLVCSKGDDDEEESEYYTEPEA